jgi:sugar phosphate isomerase/epimerase
MRIAVQSISWGRHLKDIDRMLARIQDLGYEGVEFAQHPSELGPAEALHQSMTALGLTFVGLAGGSLSEKQEYTRAYKFAGLRAAMRPNKSGRLLEQKHAPYIYVDEWEDQRSEDALKGNTLALHPHMFKSVQTAKEAERLLQKHPDLRFLPDTAHLTVAGENVLEVLRRNYDRIDSVHLKDWSAEYGRAYHFYSRGFVELGKGDVEPDAIVRFLQERGYKGWLVVEQDAAEDPYESARQSREWLRAKCGA